MPQPDMRGASRQMTPVVPPPHLRSVLRNLATGVTVVTTDTPEGPAGVSINSFTSVSLEPPLVLFCISRTSRTWPAIETAGHFAVSILGSGQERIARQFCATGVDRFAGQRLTTAWTGAPVLADAAAYLDCTLARVVDAGDHHVVIGEVVSAGALGDQRPLVFAHSRYGTF
ncbi:flavin reductase family protein [Streptomyces sp. NPDC054855]